MEGATFSAAGWRDEFDKTIKDPKPRTHALRMKIQHSIWRVFTDYEYTTNTGQVFKLDPTQILENIKLGKMYSEDHAFPCFPTRSEKTIIEVCNNDCLEEAYKMKVERGLNPVVLNMANAHTPGGGYRSGSGAQEENLHRRSNYFQYLEDPQRLFKERNWYYPIPEFGTIYSPNVTVIRGSEKLGYPYISPYHISMIACAAYSIPRTYFKDGQTFLTEEYAENTILKIRAILRNGLDNGHDAIVLSAFGCGAYRNPPAHIASLFKSVFMEDEFKDKYKVITFAILDDHNAGKQHNPDGNYKPFVEVFGASTL